MTTKPKPFRPDWASPPGHTLERIAKEKNISQKTVLDVLRLNRTELYQLYTGTLLIDGELAERLHELTDTPVKFWINRENNFRDAIARGASVVT